MTGIIVMIGGVFIFIIGVLLYNLNNKTVAQTQSIAEPEKRSEIAVTEPKIIEKDNELEKAIEIAIADGVLTQNEKNIIRKITDKKGLDFNEVIKNVEQKISDSEMESETEIVDHNKKQGDDFEKFIIQKFDKKYYRIKEWAGDKFVKGVYAETTQQPDILVELHLKSETANLWVECKWRQSSNAKSIQFAGEEQFERYKQYEKTKNIPVFVAIGIGGKGSSPKQLFIVPLQKVKYNYIYMEYLMKFEKKVDSDFFFDMKTRELN